MAYTKNTWTEGLAITHTRLNNLETQYDEAVAEGINIRKDSTKEIRVQVGTSLPGSPAAGMMFFHTELNVMYFYDGTAWRLFKGGLYLGGPEKETTVVTTTRDTAAVLVHDGFLYYTRGVGYTDWYKYNIATKTHATKPADLGFSARFENKLMAGPSGIILLRVGPSSGSDGISRYTIGANVWEHWWMSISGSVHGGDLIFDGDNTFYYKQGSGSNLFRKQTYGTAGTWTALATTPINTTHAALCYDGGNFIYCTSGNSDGVFMRYSISGNTWSYMTSCPGAYWRAGGRLKMLGPSHLVAMESRQAYYYVNNGTQYQFNKLFIYDIAANSWIQTGIGAPYDREFSEYAQAAFDMTYQYDAVTPRLWFVTTDHIWKAEFKRPPDIIFTAMPG
jgi:hypothetical protein